MSEAGPASNASPLPWWKRWCGVGGATPGAAPGAAPGTAAPRPRPRPSPRAAPSCVARAAPRCAAAAAGRAAAAADTGASAGVGTAAPAAAAHCDYTLTMATLTMTMATLWMDGRTWRRARGVRPSCASLARAGSPRRCPWCHRSRRRRPSGLCRSCSGRGRRH